MNKQYMGKLVMFAIAVAVALIAGLFIQMQEVQYKSFFVQKASMGQVDEIQQEDVQTEDDIRVNINTDNPEELKRLDGIGDKMAQRIISYRKKHGEFEVIEDIMRVSGIGEKTFEAIKDYIYVKDN